MRIHSPLMVYISLYGSNAIRCILRPTLQYEDRLIIYPQREKGPSQQQSITIGQKVSVSSNFYALLRLMSKSDRRTIESEPVNTCLHLLNKNSFLMR